MKGTSPEYGDQGQESELQVQVYDKLVRDRISAIIIRDGAKCETKTLEQEEFLSALACKLIEEGREFSQAREKAEQTSGLAFCIQRIRLWICPVCKPCYNY